MPISGGALTADRPSDDGPSSKLVGIVAAVAAVVGIAVLRAEVLG